MMIFIHNLITLCKYGFFCILQTLQEINTIGFYNYCIEFEYLNEDNTELCYCNLCYIFRNIILFMTQRLKIKKNYFINDDFYT
jgi:hypothetical protein